MARKPKQTPVGHLDFETHFLEEPLIWTPDPQLLPASPLLGELMQLPRVAFDGKALAQLWKQASPLARDLPGPESKFEDA